VRGLPLPRKGERPGVAGAAFAMTCQLIRSAYTESGIFAEDLSAVVLET
jgi:hypothetical protein